MSQLVDLPQGQLAVIIYEPTDYRGDAVLIHGFTGSKEDFDFIAPLLAERGYRTFTFDNRGQHESPHTDVSLYSISALAQDALDLARHFKLDRPHLFGHSLGGVFAQRTLLLAPNEFRSLSLFCTGPAAKPNPDWALEVKEKLTGKTMQEAWDSFAEEMYAEHPRKDLMKKRWLAHDPRYIIAQAEVLATFTSVIPEIAATKVPVHVVYGENDDAWPLSMQNQMAKDLNAPVTIIKDAGHCPNEDQPDMTAKVLANFWDSIQ